MVFNKIVYKNNTYKKIKKFNGSHDPINKDFDLL